MRNLAICLQNSDTQVTHLCSYRLSKHKRNMAKRNKSYKMLEPQGGKQ